MMTVKQVSMLTGVSIRTLQFYDEIGLLKPTAFSSAGYRLYDTNALETLQQVLFFKELDFSLKEIKTIMENPQFDKISAFQKQRELIQIKRDRLNALLALLNKLIKGEKSMDFKDFDMSEYFRVMTEFKTTHTDAIVKQFGSIEHFDEILSEMQDHENTHASEIAVKLYGSMENYTNAMKKNLTNFLEHGSISQSEAKTLIEKTEEIMKKLTADLERDVASAEVQKILRELIAFINVCNSGMDMGENYWAFMAENYLESPVFIDATDKKYGKGASKFIGSALKAYLLS